jgi:hypothetical protein
MKSFYQFQEDASSQAQSAVSASGSFKGSSDAPNIQYDKGFKKRPSTGLGRVAGAVGGAALGAAGRAAGAIKDRMGRPRPEKPQKPEGSGPTPTDGPGKRPDRAANTYRQKAAAKQQRQLPPGREQKALPPAREKSMVAKRTAAAKQPPQHKQISARPASTAMAGSRQKAIGPAKNNLSRDNQGVQKVNVKVEPQKALPPGEGKPMSGGTRPKITPKPQKALAPARE